MKDILTPSRRVELVDVAEVLAGTLGEVNADGVLIELIRGWNANGIRYADPEDPSAPIREMSAAAYAAEFYKVCGGSLDTAEFDIVVAECMYVGSILGSIVLGSVSFDSLRVLAGSEKELGLPYDSGRCR